MLNDFGFVPYLCHKTYVHRSQWPDVRCCVYNFCATTQNSISMGRSFLEKLIVYKCDGR